MKIDKELDEIRRHTMTKNDPVFIPFDAYGKAFTSSGKIRVFQSIDKAEKVGFSADCLVEYVPVRHAFWYPSDGQVWCSFCDSPNHMYKAPYCQVCGSKMGDLNRQVWG